MEPPRKRRELLAHASKRKMGLRRRAEARADAAQVTKCVFLGGLRLKPVPLGFAPPAPPPEPFEPLAPPDAPGPARRYHRRRLLAPKPEPLKLEPGWRPPLEPTVSGDRREMAPPESDDFVVLSAVELAGDAPEFEKVLLKLEAAPEAELQLSDPDDDTIDQLMYNIMDIKIQHAVYGKEFFDMPPSDSEEYSNDFGESQGGVIKRGGESAGKKYARSKPNCKICSKSFGTYLELKQHREAHNGDKPYICTKCEKNHGTLDQLLAHLRTHQGKRPYVCRKCNKSFKSQKSLEEHRNVHILRKTTVRKKVFHCEICAKEFYKVCDLERHTRVHTGEKPSVCNICSKRFQQAHNLNKHLLIHTQEKPFQCDICSKKFGRNDALNRHLLTHSVKKPNRCDVCLKSFIRVSQLDAHKKKYHVQLAVKDENAGG